MFIAEFLRQIIPVSIDIWILLFLVPMAAAAVAQFLLMGNCKRRISKWIPSIVGSGLIIMLIVGAFVGVSQILSFLALILMGTGAFILAGSLLGWLAYQITRIRIK